MSLAVGSHWSISPSLQDMGLEIRTLGLFFFFFYFCLWRNSSHIMITWNWLLELLWSLAIKYLTLTAQSSVSKHKMFKNIFWVGSGILTAAQKFKILAYECVCELCRFLLIFLSFNLIHRDDRSSHNRVGKNLSPASQMETHHGEQPKLHYSQQHSGQKFFSTVTEKCPH